MKKRKSLEEVDNDTFRQMYQGGLSKSEMEKSLRENLLLVHQE